MNEEFVAPIVKKKKKVKTKKYTNDDTDEENEEKKEEEEEEKDDEILGDGLVQIQTSNEQCTVQIRAKPLPEMATRLLTENAELLRTLQQYLDAQLAGKSEDIATAKLNQEMKETLLEFKEKLRTALEEDEFYKGAIDQIWAFGPKRNGPNILLNRIDGYERHSVWSCLESGSNSYKVRKLDHSIVSGFQLATLAGPMCEEQLMGVCFCVEKWDIEAEEEDIQEELEAERKISVSEDSKSERRYSERIEEEAQRERRYSERTDEEIVRERRVSEILEEENEEISPSMNALAINEDSNTPSSPSSPNSPVSPDDAPTSMLSRRPQRYGPLSGQLMSVVKDGCRKAFRTQPQRLMIAMYACQMQCTSEALGKCKGVN